MGHRVLILITLLLFACGEPDASPPQTTSTGQGVAPATAAAEPPAAEPASLPAADPARALRDQVLTEACAGSCVDALRAKLAALYDGARFVPAAGDEEGWIVYPTSEGGEAGWRACGVASGSLVAGPRTLGNVLRACADGESVETTSAEQRRSLALDRACAAADGPRQASCRAFLSSLRALEDDGGIKAFGIRAGSPAAECGLRNGDVITLLGDGAPEQGQLIRVFQACSGADLRLEVRGADGDQRVLREGAPVPG